MFFILGGIIVGGLGAFLLAIPLIQARIANDEKDELFKLDIGSDEYNKTKQKYADYRQNFTEYKPKIFYSIVAFGVILGLVTGIYINNGEKASQEYLNSIYSGTSTGNKTSQERDGYNRCKSCGRYFEAGDSEGNYRSIARTGMCKNCYGNYELGKDYIGK